MAIGQIWLDGSCSIIDPCFNNGTEQFPLWMLSLWKEVQKSIQYQGEWRTSVHWLDSMTHPVEIIAQVKIIVEKLSWNMPLCLRGATSLDIIGFLSTAWLSDTQIDMMVNTLQEWMKTIEYVTEVAVEPVLFSQEITLVTSRVKEPTSKYLLELADHIRRTHVKTLVIGASLWLASLGLAFNPNNHASRYSVRFPLDSNPRPGFSALSGISGWSAGVRVSMGAGHMMAYAAIGLR